MKPNKDPRLLANRRPIAVFTFLRRLFSKVIISFVTPFVQDHLHPSQRGFQPGRGCAENIFKLRKTIETAKKLKKPCVIVSFDAKNAFNGVSKAHRTECLANLPLPNRLKSALINIFEQSNIEVRHKSQCTSRIKVEDGVPQGDPASPLAFNLCIDFILQHLHSEFCGRGFSIDKTAELIALGFADDLVIAANSIGDAIDMANRLKFLLQQIGLSLNENKCKAFAINILDTPDVLCEELPIRLLKKDQVMKYLGAELRLSGKPEHKELKSKISSRCEATLQFKFLHNWQKLHFTRMFITSLLPYIAQTDFNLNVTKSPDILQANRSISLLLQTIFDLTGVHRSFIYGARNGGLGFPNADWIVANNALVMTGYLENCSDPLIEALIRSTECDIGALLHELAENAISKMDIDKEAGISLVDELCMIATDDKKMKTKRLTEKLQGASLGIWSTTKSGSIAGSQILCNCRGSNSFVRNPERFSNAEFNAALRLRGGVPYIRALNHIAAKHGSDKCRLCGIHKESLGHIMGGCKELSGLITDRHDAALSSIFDELVIKNPTWQFELEPRPNINVTHHKPDLLAVHPESKTVIIMDVTIRNESSDEDIKRAKDEKIAKYECLRHHYSMSHGARSFSVQPLWFGARGSVDTATLNELSKHFNLSSHFIESLCIRILRSSIHLYFKIIHA